MQWLGSILIYVLTACTDSAKGENPVESVPEAVEKQYSGPFLHEVDLEPGLSMSQQLQTALAKEDYEKAHEVLSQATQASLNDEDRQRLTFLLAWTAIKSNKSPNLSAEKAAKLTVAPTDYIDFLLASIHENNGNNAAAAEFYALIPKESQLAKKSQERRSITLKKANLIDESRAIQNEMLAMPDPIPNGAELIWSKVESLPRNSANKYPLLRRIWSHYPESDRHKKVSAELKAWEKKGKRYKASLKERADRAFSWMRLHMFKKVIDEQQRYRFSMKTPSRDSCRLEYALGRSLYKRNQVTKAAKKLQALGAVCQQYTPELIAGSYYISGKSLERKKAWPEAAAAYLQIPKKTPNHSMADDGYALAGIAMQESGQRQRALNLWSTQLNQYPNGDMAAEGAWRLAWNTHLSGDTKSAIAIADKMIPKLSLKGDPVHVMALKYWTARWRIYPTLAADKKNEDQAAFNEGLDKLMGLVNQHPTRYYALLAAQRLTELDPELLNKASRPSWTKDTAGWRMSDAQREAPALKRAITLAKLGLYRDASMAFKELQLASPTHMSIYAYLSQKSDPVLAHSVLHKQLNKVPPSVYEENHRQILEHAYPDKYLTIVKSVTKTYSYDPRIFHALVREESSFNKDIVSWAGARGLSQLMPSTGKAVAKWMGMSIKKKDFFDPKTNLTLGSRYFEHLMLKLKGNPFLAVAGYNAGGGNVNKWLNSKGNLPTDAFVESIPIRETRGYVKRVLGTYQLYRVLREKDAMFPNWSKYNLRARLK